MSRMKKAEKELTIKRCKGENFETCERKRTYNLFESSENTKMRKTIGERRKDPNSFPHVHFWIIISVSGSQQRSICKITVVDY